MKQKCSQEKRIKRHVPLDINALYTIGFPSSCSYSSIYADVLPLRRLLLRFLLLLPLRGREALEGDGVDVFQLGC